MNTLSILFVFVVCAVLSIFFILFYRLRSRASWHFMLRQYVTFPARASRKISVKRAEWSLKLKNFPRMRTDGGNLLDMQDSVSDLSDSITSLRRALSRVNEWAARLETLTPSVVTWTPHLSGGGVVLTGALSGWPTIEQVFFEIRKKPDLLVGINDALVLSHKRGVRIFQSKRSGLEPGATYDLRLVGVWGEMRVHGKRVNFTVPLLTEPRATTTSATVRNRTLESVNGTVFSSNLPTTYYFEYGYSEDDLQYTTAERAIGEWIGARWTHNEYLVNDPAVKSRFFRQVFDPLSGNSFVRYSAQDSAGKHQKLDGNHPRLGTIMLVKYLRTGSDMGDDGIMLGGGMADLRDAVIQVKMRGADWHARGASVCFWLQRSFFDDNKQEHISVWCFTSQPLNEYLEDGEWHDVELRLSCDSSLWSFGGSTKIRDVEHHAFAPELRLNSNFTWAPLRPMESYYNYSPISDSLGKNNLNMHFLVTFADRSNLPQGAIDFGSFDITYRNNSILAPQRGTRLVSWPDGSACDPGTLADPEKNRIGSGWQGPSSNVEPPEFVYAFASAAELEMVQLFQHSDWPAHEVEMLWSSDNQFFESLGSFVMREPEHGLDSHTIFRTHKREVRFLKIVLHSGYFGGRAGLRGLDVFGHLDTSFPGSEVSTISEDIAVDPYQRKLWYRLVAKNSKGISAGEIYSASLPADSLPRIEDVAIRSEGPRSTALKVSVNPMGHPTMATVHYETASGSSGKTKTYYAGDNHSHVDLLIEIESEPLHPLERVWVVAHYPEGEVSSKPVRVRLEADSAN